MFTTALFFSTTRKVVARADLEANARSLLDECRVVDLTINSLAITKVQESNVRLEMKEIFLFPSNLFDVGILLTILDEEEDDRMLSKLKPAITVLTNRIVGIATYGRTV